MKRYALLLLFVAATAAANTPPTVAHLHAQQRPNSQLVDITYSVVDPDNDVLTISVRLLSGSGVTIMQCTSVSGAVGGGILVGNNKHIVWDAGQDYPGQYGPDYMLRVTADDGRAPSGFVYIAPGTFTMGSPTTEPGRGASEIQHQVTLTRGFYMSRYEVTAELWHQVMSGSPVISQWPMVNVSWDMAVQFCNALSLQAGLTPAYTISGLGGNATWNQNANGYRLPTEAEWEYVCRAGTAQAFNNGTNCLSSNTEANYDGRSPLTGCAAGTYRAGRTNVGQFPANQWGLYDMHGNVWEWVWDRWGSYPTGSVADPTGPPWGSNRVARGGALGSFAVHCRSAQRNNFPPSDTYDYIGFRLVKSAD